MKKLFFLIAIFTTVFMSTASAQGGGDPAAKAQRYKERMKPQLIEKVKLTDEQADKVCDIQLASRQLTRGMRDLSEDERKKKMEEVQVELNKQYKAIPLTDDQLKNLNSFLEEARKAQQNRKGGGNRNGNN